MTLLEAVNIIDKNRTGIKEPTKQFVETVKKHFEHWEQGLLGDEEMLTLVADEFNKNI
jgi:hypothetical protein